MSIRQKEAAFYWRKLTQKYDKIDDTMKRNFIEHYNNSGPHKITNVSMLPNIMNISVYKTPGSIFIGKGEHPNRGRINFGH